MTAIRLTDRRSLLLGAAAACLAGPALAAVAAPKAGVLSKPRPNPYDVSADAEAQVAAAAARAKKAGKLLLIDLGGNWCPDCRILAGIMEMPSVKPFLHKHYEIVSVDIGRMDKNMQIPARYGFPKLAGVPAVIVVTPQGKVVNRGDAFVLADARAMSTQAVVDQLAAWIP
jgi:thiol-disulfide isomerase/thioredoxin